MVAEQGPDPWVQQKDGVSHLIATFLVKQHLAFP